MHYLVRIWAGQEIEFSGRCALVADNRSKRLLARRRVGYRFFYDGYRRGIPTASCTSAIRKQARYSPRARDQDARFRAMDIK